MRSITGWINVGLIVASAGATAGCGPMTFDVTQAIPPMAIQGSSQLAGQPVSAMPEQNLPPQDIGPADAAYLSSLVLAGTDDQGNPSALDFVREVHVLVSAPNQPIVEVANSLQTAPGSTSLTLTVIPGVNLASYLAGGCTVQTEVFGLYPAQDVTLGGQITLAVGL